MSSWMGHRAIAIAVRVSAMARVCHKKTKCKNFTIEARANVMAGFCKCQVENEKGAQAKRAPLCGHLSQWSSTGSVAAD